jgi:hypothetical protein
VIFSNGHAKEQADVEKDELLPADRTAESRAGLSQKKSWPAQLRTSADGSIPDIPI